MSMQKAKVRESKIKVTEVKTNLPQFGYLRP